MNPLLDTNTDPNAALREACDTLDAIRELWKTTRLALKPDGTSLREKGDALLNQFDNLVAGTFKVAQGITDSWDLNGYNNCLTQGASAIRELLKSGPASGGEQSFNHEHCLLIADELQRQVEINTQAFTSGGRLGRMLRVVASPPPSHLVDASTSVAKVKFLRLVNHAKTQDSEIARLQAEIKDLRFYQSENLRVWVWDGPGKEHLEALECPVLIQPEALLNIIETHQRADQFASVAVRTQQLQTRLGKMPLTGRFYLAECEKCGWVGSSEECSVSHYPADDADASCPGCGNLECQEVDSARALEMLQNLAHGAKDGGRPKS